MDYLESRQDLVMDIHFECNNCENHIEALVYVPDPDFSAEKNSDSTVETEDYILCDQCNYEHEIIVLNTFGGASCYFSDGNSNDISCGTPYYTFDEMEELQWSISNGGQLEILEKQLEIVNNLREGVNISGAVLNNSFNTMVYAHIVAALEGYLSSIFIHTVLNSKELFKKLCITNPDLNTLEYKLTDLVKDDKFVEKKISEYLSKFIFHRVDKIKLMFDSVLDHKFGDIGWFGRAVSKRHDCVHRAGITKDGEIVNISNKEINELIVNGKAMVYQLQNTIDNLPKDTIDKIDWDFNF